MFIRLKNYKYNFTFAIVTIFIIKGSTASRPHLFITTDIFIVIIRR
jgi:ammonia channel protein AmtB